ncbi:hypothetical protein RCL_jg19531.t1 [Rhizophagus clarus]|uniref:Uncharacterized protein n=1 Tax=Rhizophagus clarus TaxID=94130 RepID=A0A8H3QLY1_9GLOM|nr:hypothetical protein RCL_jg19531.t1 [Rhizophagus clarus]
MASLSLRLIYHQGSYNNYYFLRRMASLSLRLIYHQGLYNNYYFLRRMASLSLRLIYHIRIGLLVMCGSDGSQTYENENIYN